MTRAPGPPRRFPGGHLLAMRRDPLAFLTRLSREYGDVVRFRLGPVELHLLNRPDFIRDLLVTDAAAFHKGRGLERAKRLLGEGLLTSEDPVHLRQRRMIQPAFHHERIAGYGAVMVEHAERLAHRWQDGETRDVSLEMSRLTLAIVGRTLFDADVESEADEIGDGPDGGGHALRSDRDAAVLSRSSTASRCPPTGASQRRRRASTRRSPA